MLESYSYPWSAKVWKINGEPCAESTLKDGNGVMIWHRDDGSKLQKAVYVDGKQHGMVINYNRDGSTWTEEYNYRFPVYGTRNGTKIELWNNGPLKGIQKRLEMVWENGKMISEKKWDNNGKMISEEKWDNNGKKHGMKIDYFKDGSKRIETPYVDGEKHGTVIWYYQDGSTYSENPHVNGKKHGMKIGYYKDGSKWWETPYVDGERHGTSIWYFKDGSTKTSEWVQGTGTLIRYYEDGSKERETPYVDGERHGTVIEYRNDGSKLLESVYENGKRIAE